MNWIQELSSNTALHDNITSFMNQYGMPGLEQALQLYRDMHQTYICKTKTSISQINIYDIYYMEINRHNIDVHTEHGIYHKYGSLTNELKILSPYGFIRCAQNRIVAFTQIHPTCIPVHGEDQSKLTLMSESLRNDGRIWVPKKKEDAEAIRAGKKKPTDIPDEDRDFYLERRYPAFGNLCPRDIASRAAKERCDAGYGVGTGNAVYLDFKYAIERLGEDVVRDRYGNLFDMYQMISDDNPYHTPMMIFPASHYTMGGIWVDYELQTSIKGLFAIGECNFSDHGANRLGASALMQGLADGYFVLPYTMQNYLSDQIKVGRDTFDIKHPEFDAAEKGVRERIDRLMKIGGTKSPDEIHKRLGHVMWNLVGMGRTLQGLVKALEEIEEVRKEFYSDLRVVGRADDLNTELEKALRLEDFLVIARMMAIDALNRNESCGAHFREEYQTADGEAARRDDKYMYVSCWKYTGDTEKPILIKEPLKYEAIQVQTRNYKS